MGSSVYVLLDAMGIQGYVFSTNRLKTIVGASYALSRWQSDCKSQWPAAVIASAGGNVLACFDASDSSKIDTFCKDTLTNAPPGLDIACVRVEATDSDTPQHVWGCLQREIARYKCGDLEAVKYSNPAAWAPGCTWCGVRPPDGRSNGGICQVCASHLESEQELQYRGHEGTTIVGRLYKKQRGSPAFDISTEFEQLVTTEGGERESMAVVVIDLNDLGNRIKGEVKVNGFPGLEKLSLQLEGIIFAAWSRAIDFCVRTGKSRFRIRPLLMGGDDMIVALPAWAWPHVVAQVLEELSHQGFPACAGVIVGSYNFPISRLIQMAEELLANAKSLARGGAGVSGHDGETVGTSALDWHFHQEAAFSSPLSVRRHRYLLDTQPNLVESATKRPYTLEKFKELLEASNQLLTGISNRKLNMLYAGIRQGVLATRNTLVYDFLRDEVAGFKRYGVIWDLLDKYISPPDGGKGGHQQGWPLWQRRTMQTNNQSITVFETEMGDILELALTQRGG